MVFWFQVKAYLKIENFNFFDVKDQAALEKEFKTIDADNDGVITLNEFKTILKKRKATATDAEVEELFKKIDVDGSGKITLDGNYWLNLLFNYFETWIHFFLKNTSNQREIFKLNFNIILVRLEHYL